MSSERSTRSILVGIVKFNLGGMIMENITIEDLYNWAKDHNCLDYKIKIQYRDEGGTYYGSDEEVLLVINKENKTIIL